jgi:hypothetical protein
MFESDTPAHVQTVGGESFPWRDIGARVLDAGIPMSLRDCPCFHPGYGRSCVLLLKSFVAMERHPLSNC